MTMSCEQDSFPTLILTEKKTRKSLKKRERKTSPMKDKRGNRGKRDDYLVSETRSY